MVRDERERRDVQEGEGAEGQAAVTNLRQFPYLIFLCRGTYEAAEYHPISLRVLNSSVKLGTVTATIVVSYLEVRFRYSSGRWMVGLTNPFASATIRPEERASHSLRPLG